MVYVGEARPEYCRSILARPYHHVRSISALRNAAVPRCPGLESPAVESRGEFRMASSDRRRFITGMVATGAATAASALSSPAAKAAEPQPAPRVPSALAPTMQIAAAETQPPGELPRVPGKPGSDFMVDVIKTLDIKYLPANCASSYRAIHESLINYGANKSPEFLTCMHEESAVG